MRCRFEYLLYQSPGLRRQIQEVRVAVEQKTDTSLNLAIWLAARRLLDGLIWDFCPAVDEF